MVTADSATRVRQLFNERAASWGRNYAPRGKLRWRLDEFRGPLMRLMPPPGKILDLGCGSGALAACLAHNDYEVWGCDIAEEMLRGAARDHRGTKTTWVRLDVGWTRLPFPECSFDAVVASSVLEYVDSVDQTLSEIRRVLKPGGLLLFNIPNPLHRRRRRESHLMRARHTHWVNWITRMVPRAGRYLRYLELSKNRYPLAEWRTRAGAAGLRPLAVSGLQANTGALFLFAFRKPDVLYTGRGGKPVLPLEAEQLIHS